jgi:hypothetical protein
MEETNNLLAKGSPFQEFLTRDLTKLSEIEPA